ncbi:hypothetical protein [Pasteurella multocida]|uniref:hypothetical protein n=1 Tax=Pasteurella multocida TaxID=747 RepID=UPI001E485C4C|nr:hypothetical protein [Pasteurella multocida]
MKKLFILITLSLFSLASFSMTDKAQKELEKALKGTIKHLEMLRLQWSKAHSDTIKI